MGMLVFKSVSAWLATEMQVVQVTKYFSLEVKYSKLLNLLNQYKILVFIFISKTGQCPLSWSMDMMTADSDAGTPATEFLI